MKKLWAADKTHMDVSFKHLPLKIDPTQTSPLWVGLAAIGLTVLVFVGDWITPATIVVGQAYQAPVVFAGLKGTRRLTIQVTLLCIFALVLGWFMDLADASYHFSFVRIENRLLSILSLLIVSCLTIKAQRNSTS